MSANLYPGIKSLHLVLDTPYDLIRTDDVRDDLIGVKVWYSTTPNFDPKAGQGTLAFDGSGLSITISDLEVNRQYYVKYAFISAIDPTIFTVSAQLTATVYDETANIYGYLTNDPSSVFTNQDGSGGDYTTTQGVFKLFELSQDVTGAGPVYSIKPGGITGGVSGVIDPVTGFYYATAMTSNTGTITFYASYKDVVVEKVWNLTKIRDGVDGTDAPNLRVSSTGNSFVYKDDFAQTSESGSLTISTALINLIGTPTYTAFAYTRAGVLLGPITLTLQGSQAILTASNFNPPAYNNTVGYVTITSQLALVSDSITIYRNNDGSEQITVEQSNQAHTISAFTNGTVPLANYVGSGNIIRVKQGNSYLQLDNFSPYPNGTWRLTATTSVGITADPTPTVGSDYVNFDQHANMTADVAYIDYEVTGKTSTGKPFVLTVRQSFSKSKAGVEGSDAPVVNLTANTQTFIVAKNTGLVTPAAATITATVTNMVNETIAWYVDDVLQAGQTSSVFNLNSFTGTPKIVKAVATSGVVTAFDQLTLYSLREGDDALQAGLENENQTISCDSSGEPIAGQLPVASKLVVVRGAQVLTTGVVYSLVEQVNVVAAINATTGVISVSAINANSGYAVFRATVGSVQLDKRLTVVKSLNGQNGTAGDQGPPAPFLDFTGTTTFYKNSGGLISPASATLTAIAINTTSPSFSWNISGATPTSGTGTSITVTPTGLASSVTVSLTITAANLPAPVVITKTMGIVEQGIQGQVGQNGTMSAFPSIFQWTSGDPPTRPTTTSTYTWATGNYTEPSGWKTEAPSNTNAGWVLWQITVPLTVEATTTQSNLNWADTNFPIRSITVNGTAGSSGSDGTNGSASYLINRGAGTSSTQPTGSEVLTATGFRYAQLGDIATISYNNGNNSVAYRATSTGFFATWALQTTYITGSLIVENSISGAKITTGTLTADKITSGTATVGSIGQFGLGGTDRLNGFTGVGRFKRTSLVSPDTSGFTTITFNEVASDVAGAVAGVHIGPGWGMIAYNAANTNYNSFATTTAMASKDVPFLAKTNRSIGTVGNLAFTQRNSFTVTANTSTAAYFGQTAANRISEAFIGSGPEIGGGPHAGYFLLFDNNGGGTPKQVYLAQGIYSVNAPVSGGKVYVGDGVLPFTGVHDGLISDDNLPEIGDILVDHKVLQQLDISNSIVEYKISSGAKQRGVVGVCSEIHDTPPSDWSTESTVIPATRDITREIEPNAEVLPDTIIEASSGYTIPAGYKVIFVNALGEGALNVCGENGNIELGDLIVSSSMPGKGMRQDDDIVRSYTVAKARESVVFDSPGQIKRIACIYLCG